jgi:chitinase
MYPIGHLPRFARRGAFVSLAALSVLSGLGPLTAPAAAQSSALPRLDIQPSATVWEGDGSSGVVSLSVTLSEPSSTDVSFIVNTRNGTARAGADYKRIRNQRVTMLAGGVSTQILVGIVGDKVPESTEDFYVTLSSPSGATLGVATADVTIDDND